MQILITGGTGLIGRRLCAALSAEGHALTVLSRKPETVAPKCGAGVRAMKDLAEWQSEQYFDAVINLAGEPIVDSRWTEKRKQVLWDSRVTLTVALIERISQAQSKPKVLLSGSATGYYGNTGDTAVDETATPGADFGARLCAAWEDAARQATLHGVRVCLLRTGLVLSKQGGLLGRMLPSFKLGLGARLGNGRQWMSWIHIDDYVAGVLHLLKDTSASGPYNMTAPQPVSNSDFTRDLAEALHRPALVVAPAWLLRLALGEMAELLIGGQKVLPIQLQALGFQFRHPELPDAFKHLLPEG